MSDETSYPESDEARAHGADTGAQKQEANAQRDKAELIDEIGRRFSKGKSARVIVLDGNRGVQVLWGSTLFEVSVRRVGRVA